MAKVVSVKKQAFGHSLVEMDDKTSAYVMRGSPVPEVGQEFQAAVPAPDVQHHEYAHPKGKPSAPPAAPAEE